MSDQDLRQPSLLKEVPSFASGDTVLDPGAGVVITPDTHQWPGGITVTYEPHRIMNTAEIPPDRVMTGIDPNYQKPFDRIKGDVDDRVDKLEARIKNLEDMLPDPLVLSHRPKMMTQAVREQS